MGKVIEKVKLASLFDHAKSIEVDAVIDTGATMLVLPQDLVEALNLRKIRDTAVYGVVTLELKGRVGNFDVWAEAKGSEPLVGQIVLEELDLVVDASTRTLIPNPRSPEIPTVEIL